ncbi:hypothetical protein [Chitinophaga barathri]|uniref:Uncharacterized protein n=1 Tax=Chitinophaga barathri TaxID=1647451 RepID=A0A3N4MMD9_9BACT|nr:hypothetical protein [Chitinophaga barathri]RPD43187.1 hypothetical protein EG028_02505 [Chitinophaga barathri]
MNQDQSITKENTRKRALPAYLKPQKVDGPPLTLEGLLEMQRQAIDWEQMDLLLTSWAKKDNPGRMDNGAGREANTVD